MDLMRDFVRDRTINLQRLAADVHREHDLGQIARTSASAAAPATPLRLEAVATAETACDGADCVPATVARHAA